MAGENLIKLKIDNVVKEYEGRNGKTVALNGVNLDIKENEFICVVGPSGCGKSTLLNIIAGLHEPTSGAAYLDGKKIDLTFKNNSASDAYVMTYLVRSGGHWICHVDIYGEALPEGVTYDLVAETVEVLPAPVDPEYIEDKKGEHVLYIDEDPVLKRKASDGYVVDTFKVKYVNGKEVDREYVARDTYKAKSQQFYVGVKDRPLVP